MARRTLASLAVSAPAAAAVAAAAPAMASNPPTVTIGSDSGSVLATVNRGPNAIAKIDCTLTDGIFVSCGPYSSTKKSTTYRVRFPALSALPPLSCTTLVVNVTLTDGGTASGYEAVGNCNQSGYSAASIGNVFPVGANM
jgi:hypothetical protein